MPTTLDSALAELVEAISNRDSLVRCVLSGRRRNFELATERIDIKPVLIKGSILLQIMENDGVRTTTRNADLAPVEIHSLLDSGFANLLVESTSGSISLRITKKGEAQVHYEKRELVQNLEHDRKKKRLLDSADPFLIEVGISDSKEIGRAHV